MSDVLLKICARRRSDIAALEKELPLAEVRAQAESLARSEATRGFEKALRDVASRGAESMALIAELKKESPSKGVIREDFDVASLAAAYKSGGATCLSVLTESAHFGGSYEDLGRARGAVDLPILQKDFMLRAWQVYYARVVGADCILLLLGALDSSAAADLEALAHELGMSVLLEVHDAPELERALSLRSSLIGVNNRDLQSLSVDLATGESLLPLVRESGRLAIAESGLYSYADLCRLRAVGAQAFLIGESLMRAADVERATREILGG